MGDGARVGAWACGDDRDGAVRADGVRGDGVGVGDVGALHCRAERVWLQTGGDDGRCI